jgi:hypothetical protein
MPSGTHPYRVHPMHLRSHAKQPIPEHTHTFQICTYVRELSCHSCQWPQLIGYKQGLAKIDSVKDARDCLCLLRCKQDVATKVDIVEVLQGAGIRANFKAIRGILKCTTNITSLTLRLSFEPVWLMLPTTLDFVNLTILNSNIPHANVVPFLTRHPRITNLVLDTCNAASCPLIGCRLPRLEELICPPGCVQALTSVASPLSRLGVVQSTAQDSRFPLERLLDSHRIKTTSFLTVLHLDFDHTASRFGLLQSISAAAPALIVLKLTESSFSDKVRHSVRDADDTLIISIVNVQADAVG